MNAIPKICEVCGVAFEEKPANPCENHAAYRKMEEETFHIGEEEIDTFLVNALQEALRQEFPGSQED